MTADIDYLEASETIDFSYHIKTRPLKSLSFPPSQEEKDFTMSGEKAAVPAAVGVACHTSHVITTVPARRAALCLKQRRAKHNCPQYLPAITRRWVPR